MLARRKPELQPLIRSAHAGEAIARLSQQQLEEQQQEGSMGMSLPGVPARPIDRMASSAGAQGGGSDSDAHRLDGAGAAIGGERIPVSSRGAASGSKRKSRAPSSPIDISSDSDDDGFADEASQALQPRHSRGEQQSARPSSREILLSGDASRMSQSPPALQHNSPGAAASSRAEPPRRRSTGLSPVPAVHSQSSMPGETGAPLELQLSEPAALQLGQSDELSPGRLATTTDPPQLPRGTPPTGAGGVFRREPSSALSCGSRAGASSAGRAGMPVAAGEASSSQEAHARRASSSQEAHARRASSSQARAGGGILSDDSEDSDGSEDQVGRRDVRVGAAEGNGAGAPAEQAEEEDLMYMLAMADAAEAAEGGEEAQGQINPNLQTEMEGGSGKDTGMPLGSSQGAENAARANTGKPPAEPEAPGASSSDLAGLEAIAMAFDEDDWQIPSIDQLRHGVRLRALHSAGMDILVATELAQP